MVVRQIEMIWTLKYYMDPAYFGLWSKIMMPASPNLGGPIAGPPPIDFFLVSIIANIFTGIGLTLIYYYLKDYLPKGYFKRSFFFADLLVTTSFLFFTVPVVLLFRVPLTLLGYWFLSSFFVATAASMVIVKIIGIK